MERFDDTMQGFPDFQDIFVKAKNTNSLCSQHDKSFQSLKHNHWVIEAVISSGSQRRTYSIGILHAGFESEHVTQEICCQTPSLCH